MTEATAELPIRPLSVEERNRIIQDWTAGFESRKGEIVEHQKVVELLTKMSSPEAFGGDNSETLVLPGSFCFGANQEVFYVAYSHLCGGKAAEERLKHEREHWAVYERHGVPIEFGIVVSKLPDGRHHVIPLISPKFPEDMPPEQRKAIAHEANLAVTEKSEEDKTAIKKHEASEPDK